MDWSNEPYVRMYTRETDDDLVLSWDAISVWRAMLGKFDRSGVIETRRGLKGLAALLRAPFEVVERGIPELLEDGRIVQVERGYMAPNFIEAQEAVKSDRLRAKDSRERRRSRNLDQTVTKRDANVTRSGFASHGVTLTSADPDPDPSLCTAAPEPAVEKLVEGIGSRGLAPTILTADLHRTPDRDEKRRRLVRDAWNYAATKHAELQHAHGLSPTAPPWGLLPRASSEPVVALVERVEELVVEDDFAAAMNTLRRRIDVAAAVAVREQHLNWFTPMRMWDGKSFAIDAALSPEQAAETPRRRGAVGAGGPHEEPPRRIKAL